MLTPRIPAFWSRHSSQAGLVEVYFGKVARWRWPDRYFVPGGV